MNHSFRGRALTGGLVLGVALMGAPAIANVSGTSLTGVAFASTDYNSTNIPEKTDLKTAEETTLEAYETVYVTTDPSTVDHEYDKGSWDEYISYQVDEGIWHYEKASGNPLDESFASIDSIFARQACAWKPKSIKSVVTVKSSLFTWTAQHDKDQNKSIGIDVKYAQELNKLSTLASTLGFEPAQLYSFLNLGDYTLILKDGNQSVLTLEYPSFILFSADDIAYRNATVSITGLSLLDKETKASGKVTIGDGYALSTDKDLKDLFNTTDCVDAVYAYDEENDRHFYVQPIDNSGDTDGNNIRPGYGKTIYVTNDPSVKSRSDLNSGYCAYISYQVADGVWYYEKRPMDASLIGSIFETQKDIDPSLDTDVTAKMDLLTWTAKSDNVLDVDIQSVISAKDQNIELPSFLTGFVSLEDYTLMLHDGDALVISFSHPDFTLDGINSITYDKEAKTVLIPDLDSAFNVDEIGTNLALDGITLGDGYTFVTNKDFANSAANMEENFSLTNNKYSYKSDDNLYYYGELLSKNISNIWVSSEETLTAALDKSACVTISEPIIASHGITLKSDQTLIITGEGSLAMGDNVLDVNGATLVNPSKVSFSADNESKNNLPSNVDAVVAVKKKVESASARSADEVPPEVGDNSESEEEAEEFLNETSETKVSGSVASVKDLNEKQAKGAAKKVAEIITSSSEINSSVEGLSTAALLKDEKALAKAAAGTKTSFYLDFDVLAVDVEASVGSDDTDITQFTIEITPEESVDGDVSEVEGLSNPEDATSSKISTDGITFRIPVPETTMRYAKVTHVGISKTYEIKGSGTNQYIEITTTNGFSPWVVELMSTTDDDTTADDTDGDTTSSSSSSSSHSSTSTYVSVSRESGADRFATMNKVVTGAFTDGDFDTVYITSGSNFPDALAASGLAGTSNAPVLITDVNGLSDDTQSVLKNYSNVTKAVIVGGTSAVSADVASDLKALGLDVSRVSGDTRFDTADALYENGTGWGNTAFVVSGTSAADALSASSVAWKLDAPVFLADSEGNIDSATKDLLLESGFDSIIIVGGTSVISQNTADVLNAGDATVSRLSGADRYATSDAVIKYAQKKGLDTDTLYVATGENDNAGNVKFADALSAGPAAAASGHAMLLVGSDDASKATWDDFDVDKFVIVGGTSAISADLADAIKEAN